MVQYNRQDNTSPRTIFLAGPPSTPVFPPPCISPSAIDRVVLVDPPPPALFLPPCFSPHERSRPININASPPLFSFPYVAILARSFRPQEMRTVGFTDLDGKLIIGQMPSPQSRRLPAKKKKELPSAFSRPARAGGAGVGMDVSPVPSSASNNSSVDSSVDVVEAAAAAFAGSGSSATSSVRPASAHRHCRTSFRARPVSHQGNNNGYSRAGIAFAGLPARWGRGSRKDARARPSPPSANGTTSASTSAGVSPTKVEFENRTSSATRRAFSLR